MATFTSAVTRQSELCIQAVKMLSHRFLVSLCSVLLVAGIFLTLPQLCQSHGHSHDHHEHSHDHHGHAHDHHGHAHEHHGHSHDHVEERPSFKYSKEANVQKPAPPPPPAKKVQQKEHNHHGHSHEHHTEPKATVPKRTQMMLWTEAIGSTLLISVAPFIILFFIPIDSSPERQPLLKVLLSFASGGLLGDAFLHLIPHALMAHAEDEGEHHSHSHGHSHGDGHGHGHGHDMTVGMWVLGGIIAFLAVEKFVRIVKGGHGHSHSHTDPKKDSKQEKSDSKEKKNKDKQEVSTKEEAKPSGILFYFLFCVIFWNQLIDKINLKPFIGEIKVAGYLNLAADFTHNFTDGLAIGASFLAGRTTGIVTTVTVLLHEVPHEIGDFAILIQSGCDRKKVIS